MLVLQQGKLSDWGAEWSCNRLVFCEVQLFVLYKGFVCDNADRIMYWGIYSAVARAFDGRDEQ